jgi:glycogen operon protein
MKAALPEQLAPGWPMPFGAHPVDGGVHFAVWSEHASAIELCLFTADGSRELRRMPLHAAADGIWNGFLEGAGEGLVYGYRAHGPYAPEHGQRFNPHKLLLDPWARAVLGRFHWDDRHYGYVPDHPDGTRSFDTRDNAAQALKARVVGPLAPPRQPRPRIADTDVVLYELHVKGFTKQMPGIPEVLRGRFGALAHPLAIAHFHRLGVTSLCLLPVHYSLSERSLASAGLSNYWGYNTIGYFATDPRLASTADRATAELREAVEALHAAGLEVILDVVYNHSAEGDEFGPTISFRGLDNASWYRLLPDDPARYVNWSGCGNTLNLNHPRVVQFVLDSLRFWAEEVGVDGFRFDLATVLGRTQSEFDPNAPFFVALRQDPTLSRLRWIAEPWDGGPQGYQVGRFPGRFIDWNDRFRDSVRRYWLPGPGVTRGELARRFCASSELFHHGLRRPQASVNFITAHDGKPLADLVAYRAKLNHANGEANRDGRDDEPADNFGHEGPTTEPLIVARRRRARHAMLATLLLAQGTPMLLAGDEHANSQRGNNNAYCQDNPIGWLDWNADEEAAELIAALTRLRRAEALLRHPDWFVSSPREGRAWVRWLRPDGREMSVEDWNDPERRDFACELWAAGAAAPRLKLLFNPMWEEREFAIDRAWQLVFDSTGERLPLAGVQPTPVPLSPSTLLVPAQALLVLVRLP